MKLPFDHNDYLSRIRWRIYFCFIKRPSMIHKPRNLFEGGNLLEAEMPPASFNSDPAEATSESVPPRVLMPILSASTIWADCAAFWTKRPGASLFACSGKSFSRGNSLAAPPSKQFDR